jgi:hypothetical protein
VTVFDLSSNAAGVEFRGAAVVRSNVLPMLPHPAEELLLTDPS